MTETPSPPPPSFWENLIISLLVLLFNPPPPPNNYAQKSTYTECSEKLTLLMRIRGYEMLFFRNILRMY